MKAMILAAGLGTRLKPFTDHHPKALAIVNGKTLLERNIFYLHQFGITEFIVNVHHFADQIEEHLQHPVYKDMHITISDERQEVLETGGGLKKAAWFLQTNEAFVLMNVDILTNVNVKDIITKQQQTKALAVLGVSNRSSSRCFLFDENMHLSGWRNKKTEEEKLVFAKPNLNEFAFSGIHVIHSDIFGHMHQEGKFSMVDVYLDLAKLHTILGYDHSGSILLDVGKPESIIEAERLFT